MAAGAIEYEVDEDVRVEPTQGCHQKPCIGRVVKVSPTQVVVVDNVRFWGVAYRKSDGMPVKKSDRTFPCFRIKKID